MRIDTQNPSNIQNHNNTQNYNNTSATSSASSQNHPNEQMGIIKDEVILSEEAKSRSAAEIKADMKSAKEKKSIADKKSAEDKKSTTDKNSAVEKDAAASKSSLPDETAILTRRLVLATTQMEVIEIRAKAFENMATLRMAAVAGDGEDALKAKNILRRLEKLIRRAHRKLRELIKEDRLKLDGKKAAEDNNIALAKKIENELKRRQADRKARERRYLYDSDEDEYKSAIERMRSLSGMNVRWNGRMSISEEQRIEMMAKMQAQAITPFSGANMASMDLLSGSDGESGGAETGEGMDASVDSMSF